MGTKNIFDKETFEDTIARINNLIPESQGIWGKMSVSQMLAHMTQAVKVVTDAAPPPRMLAGRLIGWALKKKVYDDSMIQKNLPTAPAFLIRADKDLDKERAEVLRQLNLVFAKGQAGVHNIAHPFFGKLTGEQWGKGIWKHFDHHLRQFNV